MADTKLLTVRDCASAMRDFTGETRGKLYSFGNAIHSLAKVAGIEKQIGEWFTTQATVEGIRVDAGFVSKCLSASSQGKRANKAGCYAEWIAAGSDSEAKAILDTKEGKTPKAKTVKSDLQKAVAAIDKLSDADKRVCVAHLSAVKSSPESFAGDAKALALAAAKIGVDSYNAVLDAVVAVNDEVFGNPALDAETSPELAGALENAEKQVA